MQIIPKYWPQLKIQLTRSIIQHSDLTLFLCLLIIYILRAMFYCWRDEMAHRQEMQNMYTCGMCRYTSRNLHQINANVLYDLIWCTISIYGCFLGISHNSHPHIERCVPSSLQLRADFHYHCDCLTLQIACLLFAVVDVFIKAKCIGLWFLRGICCIIELV